MEIIGSETLYFNQIIILTREEKPLNLSCGLFGYVYLIKVSDKNGKCATMENFLVSLMS
jgi:hypothetical protein